ncbi:MAG: hypothetical protein CMJ28_01795 [Phycisphaerae bacterium]|nr:hypothetical protein [Phycisphaerae bacterium]
MQSTDQVSTTTDAPADEAFSFAFLQDWLGWLPETTFLDVAAWQWAGLALVIFLGLVGQVLIKVLLGRVLGKIIGGDADIQRKLLSALGLAAAGFIWSRLLPFLVFEGTVLQIFEGAARVFLVMAGTLAGLRGVDGLGAWATRQAGRSESTLDDILVPLGRKTLKVLVVAMGAVNLAPLLGLHITPLLGALGVGGIGFAFAAQNTLENLFGSVTVVLDRPFSVGDWVQIDGVDGSVEEVGLRSTRVRTFYNSIVSIPNAKLTTAIVDNYGEREYRRFKATLGVRYETTPEQVEAFCSGVKTLVMERSDTRKDVCYVELNSFGDSSLNVLLYMFFDCPTWADELRGRHELMLDILRLAQGLGIEFAFPTQTLHLGDQALPGKLPTAFEAMTDAAAQQHGTSKAKEIGGRG